MDRKSELKDFVGNYVQYLHELSDKEKQRKMERIEAIVTNWRNCEEDINVRVKLKGAPAATFKVLKEVLKGLQNDSLIVKKALESGLKVTEKKIFYGFVDVIQSSKKEDCI